MNILVTGAKGFIGRNLLASLQYSTEHNIYAIDHQHTKEELASAVEVADFVFHLAGVNRPETEEEFFQGNEAFTEDLVGLLAETGRPIPIVFSSSIQAELDNAYGLSKRAAEEAVFAYGKETQAPAYVYRFPNIFGKWSRPHYNSVVATFCHQVSRGEPIEVHDAERKLTLVYIDDVIADFMKLLDGDIKAPEGFMPWPESYEICLGDLAEQIQAFKASRDNRMIPNMADPLTKKLYSTYVSFLPEDDFSYPLLMHSDHRGSFTEFIKSPEGGQVSINVAKPGIVKGNHWHHTKVEKFLVVSGEGLIRFRALGEDRVIEYPVSEEYLEVVDIPVGYAHDIINTGTKDLVTIMWVNELYDPDQPDTYAMEVVSDEEA